MVKADAKHDYYADLEVPATADQETIKKQFRLLAKQYHPDRNPGKETEVVAKFQAVQAAHEILSDAQQKAKYDTDRSKYLKKAAPDPYTFKRAQTTKVPPPSPAFHQPPPKSRNASVDRSQFANSRPQSASTSAEKFAAFTRAPPQQWDRAKFEEAAAKAEALRNFQSMRGQPPPHPPRPARAPTAPKPGTTTPSQDYNHTNGPSPGFPGLSRTQSMPRKQGFSPATAGSDEPPAKSAYAYVHSNRDKSWSYQNAPSPPPTSATSGGYGPYQSESTLRSSQSSSGLDSVQRPAFGRTPSRYASNSGEKTNINGAGLGRSASVRNSPIDKSFGDHGPFGARARSSQEFMQPPPPRHHSASPKMKPPRAAGAEFSGTETSSSEDETARRKPRPKAVPRRSRPTVNDRSTSNDPALMGQYPNKNYTRIVDDTQYVFPLPETRDVPYRKPFNGMPTPLEDVTDGIRSTGLNEAHQGHPKPSSSNPNLRGKSGTSPSRNNHHQSSFSASDWDGKFGNGENIFAPNERDRKSPTKTSRTRQTGKSRGAPIEIEDDSDGISPTMAADRKSRPKTSPEHEHTFPRATFSADDWADRLKSQNAPRNQSSPQGRKAHVNSVQDANELKETGGSIPDPMDIDTNGWGASKPVPSIHIEPESRRGSGGGVNLSDLAELSPFKPSADGLQSLSSDLAGTLPFKSRAADQVQLTGPSGAALRGMSLPKPPKPILAPDDVTQDTWESYWKRMQQYMHDWSAFNIKMIDHFRMRQEQIDHNMYKNWVMGEGEGANAQDVDGSDITSPPGSAGGENAIRKPKAGYHTYMQWLEQDALCRSWWSAAFEEHRECLDELGRMRRTVKAIRDRQEGPGSAR